MVFKWSMVVVPMLAFVALKPAPVHACGATPCDRRDDVLPSSGRTGVPTNTQLRMRVSGTFQGLDTHFAPCEAPFQAVKLVAADGTAQELKAEVEVESPVSHWLVARPAELAPLTRFSVQVQLDRSGSACGCTETSWTEVSKFTTGDGPDHAAPQYAGLTRIDYGSSVEATSDCGRQRLIGLLPQSPPAHDDSPDLRWNVYIDGMLYNRSLDEFRDRMSVSCFESIASISYEVRAIDLAGNESEAHPPTRLEDPCSHFSAAAGGSPANADAGVIYSDGGREDDGGAIADDQGAAVEPPSAGHASTADAGSHDARSGRAGAHAPKRIGVRGCSALPGTGASDALPWLVAATLLLGLRRRA